MSEASPTPCCIWMPVYLWRITHQGEPESTFSISAAQCVTDLRRLGANDAPITSAVRVSDQCRLTRTDDDYVLTFSHDEYS